MLLFIGISITIAVAAKLFGGSDHTVPKLTANTSESSISSSRSSISLSEFNSDAEKLINENERLISENAELKRQMGIRSHLYEMAVGIPTSNSVSTQTDKTFVLDQTAYDKYVKALMDARVATERYAAKSDSLSETLTDLAQSMYTNREFARAMIDTVEVDHVSMHSMHRFVDVNEVYMDLLARHPNYRIDGDLQYLAYCNYKGDIVHSAFEPTYYSIMPLSMLISLSMTMFVLLMSPSTRLYLLCTLRRIFNVKYKI
jgi:hypothetical protein